MGTLQYHSGKTLGSCTQHIKNSTKPFDSIFASADLISTKCGYASFTLGSQIRSKYALGFSNDILFWANLPPMRNPQCRRLKFVDTKVVHKFMLLRNQHAEAKQFVTSVRAFESVYFRTGPYFRIYWRNWSLWLITDWRNFAARSGMQKNPSGKVPWSPLVTTIH